MFAAPALCVALAFDLGRQPESQYAARGADALIGVYQTALSPLLVRAGVRCRFVPSCSEYARAQVRARGLAAGGLSSVARLAWCGPWTPFGTVSAGLLTRGQHRAAKRHQSLSGGLLTPGEDPAAKRRPH